MQSALEVEGCCQGGTSCRAPPPPQRRARSVRRPRARSSARELTLEPDRDRGADVVERRKAPPRGRAVVCAAGVGARRSTARGRTDGRRAWEARCCCCRAAHLAGQAARRERLSAKGRRQQHERGCQGPQQIADATDECGPLVRAPDAAPDAGGFGGGRGAASAVGTLVMYSVL